MLGTLALAGIAGALLSNPPKRRKAKRKNPTPPGQRALRLARLLVRANKAPSEYSRSVQTQLYRATLGSVRPGDLRAEHGAMRKMKRENPQSLYRLADGRQVTAAQLRRMFMGKIPGPVHRRLLGITKLKKNPRRSKPRSRR